MNMTKFSSSILTAALALASPGLGACRASAAMTVARDTGTGLGVKALLPSVFSLNAAQAGLGTLPSLDRSLDFGLNASWQQLSLGQIILPSRTNLSLAPDVPAVLRENAVMKLPNGAMLIATEQSVTGALGRHDYIGAEAGIRKTYDRQSIINDGADAPMPMRLQSKSSAGMSHGEKYSGGGSMGGSSGNGSHPKHREPSSIKRSWKRISPQRAVAALKKAAEDNDSVSYASSDGNFINLDPADVIPLAKQGLINVYVDPKADSDADDETGRTIWLKEYYFTVPAGSPLAGVASHVDRLVSRAKRISDAATKGLEEFHSAIHASNVNGMGQPLTEKYIRAVKMKVNKAREKAPAIIASFEGDSSKWQAAVDGLNKTLRNERLAGLFAGKVLKETAPSVKAGMGIGIDVAKAILKVDALIFDRPEIMSVDPGFGDVIRIELDVETVMRGRGTMKGYIAELNALVKKHGIAVPLDVETRIHMDELQWKIVDTILAPVIGADNLAQIGRTGSPDSGSLTFDVRPAVLEQARALKPRIRKFLEPYDLGWDKIAINGLDENGYSDYDPEMVSTTYAYSSRRTPSSVHKTSAIRRSVSGSGDHRGSGPKKNLSRLPQPDVPARGVNDDSNEVRMIAQAYFGVRLQDLYPGYTLQVIECNPRAAYAVYYDGKSKHTILVHVGIGGVSKVTWGNPHDYD